MMRRWEDGEDEGFHPTKLQGQQQPELSTNTFILKHINSTARHYIVSCALGAETNRNFGQHVKYDHDDDEMMMHWLNVKYTLEIGRGCMNMDCSLFSFTGQPAIQFSPLAHRQSNPLLPLMMKLGIYKFKPPSCTVHLIDYLLADDAPQMVVHPPPAIRPSAHNSGKQMQL